MAYRAAREEYATTPYYHAKVQKNLDRALALIAEREAAGRPAR